MALTIQRFGMGTGSCRGMGFSPFGPGDGNVEATWIRDKPNVGLIVAPDRAENHDVSLPALEAIH